MVVEGIHVEDIFELVSLVISLIKSWTFRILANEEDHTVMFGKYSADFWSIALKQTKAGLQSSGTPVLVNNNIKNMADSYTIRTTLAGRISLDKGQPQ